MTYGTAFSAAGRRRISFRVLLACVIVALVCAQPAAAQEKPVLTSSEGPGYEVFEDGTIVIGGDVVGDCRSLFESAKAAGTQNSKEIQRQVRVCTEAGFPPRGAPLPSTGGQPILPVAVALLLVGCALIRHQVSGFG